MRKLREEHLEEDLVVQVDDEEEEGFTRFKSTTRERYTVAVNFSVMSSDPDTVEDCFIDMLSEIIKKYKNAFKPDMIVSDCEIVSIDPAELD